MTIKNISIERNIIDNIFIEINESLAEILVSNIILNAIKHNYQNGNIKIDLTSNCLIISNTGDEPHENTQNLFERFKKDSSSGDSIGLGLAIVKTICDTYHFTPHYFYNNRMHILKISFDESER
jgi:signal transduction histidine kinase